LEDGNSFVGAGPGSPKLQGEFSNPDFLHVVNNLGSDTDQVKLKRKLIQLIKLNSGRTSNKPQSYKTNLKYWRLDVDNREKKITINCANCGAEIKNTATETFLICPFCDSSLYIDRSKVLFHYMVKPTLDMPGAHRSLRGWMAGNQTVENLDRQAKTISQEFFFFPFWRFVLRRGEQEEVVMEPAAATTIYQLKQLKIPAGAMVPFRREEVEDPQVYREVENDFQKVIQRVESRGVSPELIKEASIVHVPVYRFTYHYRNWEYTALVEGSTGKTLAAVYPEKLEVPYTATACEECNDEAISKFNAIYCRGIPTWLPENWLRNW